MSKSVILIPSRLSATRLPGKPLLKINGVSIISHVFQKAKEADIGEVYVATEDKEILDDDESLVYEQKTGLQTLPHRFDIDFYSGNNELEGSKYLMRIRNASITSFSVDYETEGNPAFFKDTSAPISSTLNITFTESKIYTRNVDEDLYGS